MFTFDDLIFGLIAGNIVLTGVLVYVYLNSLKAIKSKFTIGLLFFSFAFLVENILDFYFYDIILGQNIYGFTTIQLTLNSLEFAGLLAMLYIAWK
ncbi:MAG: hypothetical protein HY519_03760 [Candidatus Aenigmarchaeota archaeon]|nr:hypothetical protein [Candidatus Aenigmarchaeota archaeon]